MDTNNSNETKTKPVLLNREQRGARIALFFDLRNPLTKAEAVAALDTLYADWPESLKQKAGPLGELVRIEDERATAPSPERYSSGRWRTRSPPRRRRPTPRPARRRQRQPDR